MGTPLKVVLITAIIVGSFSAGVWYKSRSSGRGAPAAGRRILYYHDPMHPAYKSDKPGIAPDCGMQLEPVYRDQQPAMPDSSDGSSSPPPGSVQISPDKQQVIGIRVAEVGRASGTLTLRVLGRVAADERRIYRLNAAVDGWIRQTFDNSTGSLVKKDEPLVAFYSPEFLAAQQAYLYALGAFDRFQATGKETPAQIDLTKANIQQYVDSLRNLGMGEIQIEEMKKTRQLTQNIYVYSPAAGFVLARNVSLGQRFDKGTELYRIADLSRVWILADTFENEALYFRPGQTVPVRYQSRALQARVSDVLPQFDPATRTLKVRLEADNPGYALRPDMFVDVELPVRFPPAITVPADAVLDSGLKKTVFVDRGNGYFEPRHLETGWRLGDRVQILEGLMPGERIVVSGNFLLDSESRMKLAAEGMKAATTQQDPVCGMEVDPGKSSVSKSQYRGKTYYFCSDSCKQKFDSSPERYPAKKR